MPDTAKIFSEIVTGRHSGRTYDPTKTVSPDHLNALIEAARWAPSCYGEEPWRFLICAKKSEETSPSAYDIVLGSLAEPNQAWAKHAPILIVVAAHTHLSRNNTPNAWAAYDTGAAAQNMMLAASANGLMMHPMGGFDAQPLITFFNIPETVKIMAVMALGYEAAFAPKNPSPRTRQPQETRFFFETWGA